MLRGRTINLRLARKTDVERIAELDADVYARGPHFPLMMRTEVSLAQRYEKDGMWGPESGFLFIVDPVDDRIIGSVVHFKAVHYYDAVEIGYILFKPEDRGKGYMTEAVALFTKYLFDSMKISRVQIQCEPGNLGSKRVAEKCGYKFEGLARSAFISRGKPCDILVYSRVLADLEE